MAPDALAAFPVLEEFGRPEFAADPAGAYRAAHALPGPGIFRMHNGDGLIVTAYQTLAKLRAHPALGAQNRGRRQAGSGPAGGLAELAAHSPFFMSGPIHDPIAKAIYKPLGPARSHPMTERLTTIAEQALDPLLEQGGGDLVADYARAIALHFWTELLGLPRSQAPLLDQWSAAISPMLQFENTQAERDAANAAAAELWQFLSNHWAHIKDEPGGTLMHQALPANSPRAFARIEDEPGSTLMHLLAPDIAACDLPDAPPDAAAVAAAISFDGIDSAAGGVANALHACLRFPDQHAKLVANPELIPAATTEAMRFAPAFIGLHRSALQGFAYEDAQIPAGVNLFMCWGAANRDPRIFPHPDRFDIERKGRRHLTFGGGPRICKGRYLAQLEAELALKVLLEKTQSVQPNLDNPTWSKPGAARVIQSLPATLAGKR